MSKLEDLHKNKVYDLIPIYMYVFEKLDRHNGNL